MAKAEAVAEDFAEEEEEAKEVVVVEVVVVEVVVVEEEAGAAGIGTEAAVVAALLVLRLDDVEELMVAFQWSHVGGLLRQEIPASLLAARSMASACFCWRYILETRQDKSRLKICTLL